MPTFYERLREAGVPQEHIDEFETLRARWAELVAELNRVLEAAGFRPHDPQGPGGGYWICWHLRDDAVMVDWVVTSSDSVESGDRISGIMNPALQAILNESGFTTDVIPPGEDDAGSVLVTGRTVASSV